jgi:hypothetical protein
VIPGAVVLLGTRTMNRHGVSVPETLENPGPDSQKSFAEPVDGNPATVALPKMGGKSLSA